MVDHKYIDPKSPVVDEHIFKFESLCLIYKYIAYKFLLDYSRQNVYANIGQ